MENNTFTVLVKIIEVGPDLTELKSNIGCRYLYITAKVQFFIFHEAVQWRLSRR